VGSCEPYLSLPVPVPGGQRCDGAELGAVRLGPALRVTGSHRRTQPEPADFPGAVSTSGRASGIRVEGAVPGAD
jgi:hypothetical protein